MSAFESPRLLADIGGTFARFALETSHGQMAYGASLRCAEHEDFACVMQAYLRTLPSDVSKGIENAAIAIATPVMGDEIRMTNYPWQFSIEAMRNQFGLENLLVVNDFTALAMAIPSLHPQERRQVGSGTVKSNSVIGVIGAGSGLGVSGLIPAGGGWVALGTEGGHTSFSPRDAREIAILEYAWGEYQHVSFERMLSGPGLALIYRALAQRAGLPQERLAAAEITERALAASDPIASETVEVFCCMLGTAAANLAVTQGAFGGIYIGGGIVGRLGAAFDRSGFRQRFEDKGRFSQYMKDIPTFVITATDATLVGASIILSGQLRALQSSEGSAIISQIARVRHSMTPAEQRVADYVLAHPRAVVTEPIAQIAAAVEVSQPTVIRFCRSLGCEGLSDFKLRLASGLSGTTPVTHTEVTRTDSMLEMGAKVLGNTVSAILQAREGLNRDSIDRATTLLCEATRVEFFASGHDRVLADDAYQKLLRMGIACSAYSDPALQLLGAATLQASSVVVLICTSARNAELLQVLKKAQDNGAKVIAITVGQSPLARKADVALIVNHEEDDAVHLPTISRILHLLFIDILVVGINLRKANTPLADIAPAAHYNPSSAAMGVSTTGRLANLTLHER